MIPYFSPTGLILIIILAVTTFSGVGLVALWAGLGKGHWFFRLAAAVALIAIPLAVPAYELVVLFFLQSAFTILPLLLLRKLQRHSLSGGEVGNATLVLGRTQFFLRDLLLVMVIAAPIFAVFAQIPREIWADGLKLMLGGLVLAVIALIGAWVALGRARLWRRLIVLLLFFPSALIAIFLGLIRAGNQPGGEEKKFPVRYRLRKATATLLSLLILLPPAFAYYKLLTPKPIPETTYPDPNGYQELVQTAQTLVNVTVPEDNPSLKVLKTFVFQQRSVLYKAHTVLQRPCQVSLRYEWSDLDLFLKSATGFRQIARAFEAEGRHAHLKGRDADATRIFLDELRLADAVSRGGLIVHMLVGCAIDGIGVTKLAEIRESLSADQCRELINTLRKIEAGREPMKDFLARDEAWEEHAYRWKEQLALYIYRLEDYGSKSLMEFAFKRHQAEMQLLLGELALRGYRLEHGKSPSTLADLIPRYLATVPQDPFSENPLIYRRTPKGYLLYSIGPDGKDNGGTQEATPETQWQGDLLLDKPAE